MALASATRLGPYRIESLLGAGGMGEVYRAVDTRLDRTVAIKVLPADKLADEERKRRFIQEAKSASALNHPNIVTIYEVESANGIDFLVMEFVPGKTLDHVIPKRGLRVTEALRYSVEIADALAAAHAAGIVHRDLKPGNVMVTPEGVVKLLDFGLAKLAEVQRSETSDTTATVATSDGMLVGTASYMSPEQAEGKGVDSRSDLFSFGCVLYEMLTGHRAFHGHSPMSTLSAVLRSEPKPLTQMTPEVPHELERIVNRCLRKEPKRRFQTAQDLKVALEELLDESDSGKLTPQPAAPARTRHLRWAAVFVAVAIAAAVWMVRVVRERPTARMSESPLTALEGFETQPAFSPDGNQVVFVWNGQRDLNTDIYVRVIGAGQPVALTNSPEGESSPSWSPDGRWIAFLRRLGNRPGGALMVMPAVGGGERKVAEVAPALGSRVGWSPDGKALVCSDRIGEGQVALVLISADTGEKRLLLTPPAGSSDAQATFSPDGRRIAFVRYSGPTPIGGNIFILNVDEGYRAVGEPTALTSDGRENTAPEWTGDGKTVVFSSTRHGRAALWIANLGGGPPVRIDVAANEAVQPAVRGERLAYVNRVSDSNVWRIPAVGGGQPTRLLGSTLTDAGAQYSPDGERLVYCSDQDGSVEIWAAGSDGSRPARLTNFNRGHTCGPHWSPDGNQIVFDSNAESGQMEIYVISADGGKRKRLTDNPAIDAVPVYSRDAKWIYFSSNRTGRLEIWKLPAEGGQAVQVTANGGYVAYESPDGQTLWYMKRGGGPLWRRAITGRPEQQVLEHVAFRNFVPTPAGVYFMRRDRAGASFHVLDVATGKVRDLGSTPRPILNGFDVSPDGRWLVYSQYDQLGSDISLVEKFR